MIEEMLDHIARLNGRIAVLDELLRNEKNPKSRKKMEDLHINIQNERNQVFEELLRLYE